MTDEFITPPAELLGQVALKAYIASFDPYVDGDPARAAIPWEYLPDDQREPWRMIGLAIAREIQKANQP